MKINKVKMIYIKFTLFIITFKKKMCFDNGIIKASN